MKRLFLFAFAIISILATSVYSLNYFIGTRQVYWEGETGIEMLHQVQADLDSMHKGQKLVVTITSPGGPVVTSLEIARLVRQASDRGVIVEIHATALCASGCTIVLSSGTPNYRFITKQALFLVHPPQQGSGFGPSRCVDRVETPKDVDEKVSNVFYDSLVNAYVKYTGKDKATILELIKCGNEQVGFGVLALQLGIADRLE